MSVLCIFKSTVSQQVQDDVLASLATVEWGRGAEPEAITSVVLPQASELEQSDWCHAYMSQHCKEHGPMTVVVVAGGDGTLQISLKGLVAHAKQFPDKPLPELCLLPLGTGNLVAENLAIPNALEHINYLSGQYSTMKVPIAMANEHYFLLLAGLGATPEVMAETSPVLKRWLGIWAYLYTGIRVFLCSSHRRYWVVTPQCERHYFAKAIIISHTATYLGPFMPLIPSADAEQPAFTFSVISFPRIQDHLRLLKDLIWPTETFSFRSTVQTFTAESAVIHVEDKFNHRLPTQLDGNLLGQLPLNVRFTPHVLTVRVPKDAPAYLQKGRQGISNRHSVETPVE